MVNFDKGPTQKIVKLFAQAPDYTPYKDNFWFDWGPVFYRGRLNRSARLLCLASDPGPTERLAGRTLVGDAGQRVQVGLAVDVPDAAALAVRQRDRHPAVGVHHVRGSGCYRLGGGGVHGYTLRRSQNNGGPTQVGPLKGDFRRIKIGPSIAHPFC